MNLKILAFMLSLPLHLVNRQLLLNRISNGSNCGQVFLPNTHRLKSKKQIINYLYHGFSWLFIKINPSRISLLTNWNNQYIFNISILIKEQNYTIIGAHYTLFNQYKGYTEKQSWASISLSTSKATRKFRNCNK